MLQRIWMELFTFDGRVGRNRYLLFGSALVAIKYGLDASIAAHFGQAWHIWNYFVPPADLSVLGWGNTQPRLYFILWAVAIPFFWIGISLTLRRLRDAGDRLGWLLLFFVPVANLALFLWLSAAPSNLSSDTLADAEPAHHAPRAIFAGVLIAAALGVILTIYSSRILVQYTWGLFLGVPFATGFVASWIANHRLLRSTGQTIAVSAVSPVAIGLALIGLRLEGLICLVMAIPLAVPFSIAGGLFARQLLRSCSVSPRRMSACVAILPLLMFVEHEARLDPPVRPVVTQVTIDAPASVVWENVIAFPPLAPPTEWIFHTGIAYPLGATISGSGPGAIRYCRFSTGDFVEPVTTWDEGHLLAFNVIAQPPSLSEIGFGKVSTTHIDRNYMRSQHGQFRLIAIDDQHTTLEGTTWYQDYFWPQLYWRPISDGIVHRIHERVLEHVKRQSEMQFKQSTNFNAKSQTYSVSR